MMPKLMSHRKSLTVGVMQRVDADHRNSVFDQGHAGELLIKRGELHSDAASFDNFLDGDGSVHITIILQDYPGLLPRIFL